MKKFHIYGRKNGCKEFLKSELGREAAQHEVDKLNDLDDGITYHKEFVKEIETQRFY
jgi:hypothetical protein